MYMFVYFFICFWEVLSRMDDEEGSEIATFRRHCGLSDFNNLNLLYLHFPSLFVLA